MLACNFQDELALRWVDSCLRTSEYRPINIFVNFYSGYLSPHLAHRCVCLLFAYHLCECDKGGNYTIVRKETAKFPFIIVFEYEINPVRILRIRLRDSCALDSLSFDCHLFIVIALSQSISYVDVFG